MSHFPSGLCFAFSFHLFPSLPTFYIYFRFHSSFHRILQLMTNLYKWITTIVSGSCLVFFPLWPSTIQFSPFLYLHLLCFLPLWVFFLRLLIFSLRTSHSPSPPRSPPLSLLFSLSLSFSILCSLDEVTHSFQAFTFLFLCILWPTNSLVSTSSWVPPFSPLSCCSPSLCPLRFLQSPILLISYFVFFHLCFLRPPVPSH